MDDLELVQRLTAFHREGSADALPPGLRDAIMEIPAERSRQPARLQPTQVWKGFSGLSAVRLAAAAVVVLFVGLLFNVLTAPRDDATQPAAVSESPSPTTEESLSGMVTEEVEPGVFRVLHDGVRDLVSVDAVDIVAGHDGGVWLLQEDRFLRLGNEGSHAWPTDLAPEDHVVEIAPDGAVWVMPPILALDSQSGRGDGLRSIDGEEWSIQSCPPDTARCQGLMLAPDGTAWASWWDEGGRRVGHLGASGWQPLDGTFPSGTFPGGRLYVTDAGDVYATHLGWLNPVFRYEDGAWDRISYAYMLIDVGPDGTVWQDGKVDGLGDLNRFSDGEWASWDLADLTDIEDGFGLDQEFMAAPDGSLWFSLWRYLGPGDPREGPSSQWGNLMSAVEAGRLRCDGVARFDGERVDTFLPGQCISMDIASDGSVWLLASESKGARTPAHLYVITPRAVATTG